MNEFFTIRAGNVEEAKERVRALREGCDVFLGILNSMLADAGTLMLPDTVERSPAPTLPPPRANVVTGGGDEAAPVRTDREPPVHPADDQHEGGNAVTEYKYLIRRGGGGPTYADAVDNEVTLPEFDLDMAWEIIRPHIAPPHPDDWKHSLRRSLRNLGKGRFEEIPGRKDWWRRVARPQGSSSAGGLFEPGMEVEQGDDGQDVQQNDTAVSVGAHTAVSDDRFGGHPIGGDRPRLELNPSEG